jgi:Heavy metal binding domain
LKLFYSLLCATALVTASAIAQGPASAESPVPQKYTCLMHPEVIRDAPGDCPKCGMPLVPMRQATKRADHVDGKDLSSTDDHGHASTMPEHAGMKSSIDIADPMSRESSGTSWVPDSTPMYGKMFMFGDDMLMLHGGVFPRYTNVDGPRGDDRIDAPNWFMGMYSHPFSDTTQVGLRGMMSLDPLTEGGRGYPLLYQTGETWHDQPLHDRQHPHDLFDELSASVSQMFGNDFSGFLYFGYPGEPALGPPAFMHRLSAMDNPDAPISHHWQDSTHITFGVATLGLVWKDLKLEGSTFTGREPNEDRNDFDRPRFDSASVRLSWNPTPDLALQISHGYIKSPETLEPEVKVHRTTASVIYNRRLGPESNWSNSFVWGQNDTTREGKSQSFLVETDFQWKRETVYGRFEYVQKSGDELVLMSSNPRRMYDIKAFSLGYVHDFCHGKGIDVGLGGEFTVDVHPDSLNRYYGDNPDFGFQVFFRIRPSQMGMAGMSSMTHGQ